MKTNKSQVRLGYQMIQDQLRYSLVAVRNKMLIRAKTIISVMIKMN